MSVSMRCPGGPDAQKKQDITVQPLDPLDVQIVHQKPDVRIWMFGPEAWARDYVWGCKFLSDVEVMDIPDCTQRMVAKGQEISKTRTLDSMSL